MGHRGVAGTLRQAWSAADPATLEQLLTGARSRMPVKPMADRAAWTRLDPVTCAAIQLAASEEQERPWPNPTLSQYARFWRDGVRTGYEDEAGRLRDRAALNVVTAAITGEQRWLDEAADGLLMLCEQTSWCWAAHESFAAARGEVVPDLADPYVDLGAGETVALLGWSDLVLDGALDARVPGLRRRLRAETLTRVITPFLERRDWHWLGLDGRQHNWNPWIHGNVLVAALFLVDDPGLRTEVVEMAIEGLDRYVAALPADGGCDEGYSYWWYGPSRLAEALELLEWATGGELDAVAVPVLTELARFPQRMALGGGWYVNVADGPARPSPDQPWHVLHRWGSRIGDPDVMAQAASHRDPRFPLVNLAAGLGRALVGLFDPAWATAEPTPAPLPATTWLPDVQVLVAREEAGTPAGLTLAAKGGHNAENHNHNDVGSYLVAYDGTPVLIDLGQPTYTRSTFNEDRYSIWTMQSQWHNLPTVNGFQQSPGAEFAARDVRVDLTGGHAELRLDIAGAYPTTAACTEWQRRVCLDRTGAHVTVTDAWIFDDSGNAVLHHVIAGTVLHHREGSLAVSTLAGGSIQLSWDPTFGTGELEHHKVDDPLLAGVWGDSVARLSIPLGTGLTGTFTLAIAAENPYREGATHAP